MMFVFYQVPLQPSFLSVKTMNINGYSWRTTLPNLSIVKLACSVTLTIRSPVVFRVETTDNGGRTLFLQLYRYDVLTLIGLLW